MTRLLPEKYQSLNEGQQGRQFFANETKTNKTKKNASAEGGQSGIPEESQNDAILIFEEPVAKRAKFHHAPKIERVLKIVGLKMMGAREAERGIKRGWIDPG